MVPRGQGNAGSRDGVGISIELQKVEERAARATSEDPGQELATKATAAGKRKRSRGGLRHIWAEKPQQDSTKAEKHPGNPDDSHVREYLATRAGC
eukprot:5403374-Amphidinium_carterae.1